AVPDHALADDHDAGNQHELDVGAEERLLPGIPGRQPLGLDLLEDRRLTQLEPDVDRDRDQQERHQEWHAPGPGIEHLFAIVATHSEHDRQSHHDPERRRSWQPTCVRAAAFVRNVLGHVGYGAAVFAPQTQALYHA